MTLTREEFLNYAKRDFQRAETARKLKKHHTAAIDFSTGLNFILTSAVNHYETPAAGIQFFTGEQAPRYISLCATETTMTMEQIRSGELNASIIAGTYHLLAIAHLAWLVGCDAEAKAFVDVANEPRLGWGAGKFWADYGKGMACLIEHRKYQPAQLKLKTWEKHWDTYREFMHAVTLGEDVSENLSQIRMSFEKRNRDRRLADNDLDGSGHFPVHWDFRRESLIHFVRREYGECHSIS